MGQGKVDDVFLRLPQIIGQKEVTPEEAAQNRKTGCGRKTPRKGVEPIIPICKAAWWRGIQQGRYPKGRKLSPGVTVWLASEIFALLDRKEG